MKHERRLLNSTSVQGPRVATRVLVVRSKRERNNRQAGRAGTGTSQKSVASSIILLAKELGRLVGEQLAKERTAASRLR